jgi:GT2 family glycosyltransferase
MWVPSPVISLDLTEPFPVLARFRACRSAQALLTWNGVPCAWHEIPIVGDRLATSGLVEAIVAKHVESISKRVLREHLLAGPVPTIETMFAPAKRMLDLVEPANAPTMSVALCTRNRPDDLRMCLRSLCALQPAPLEILVVDNAPSDDRSKEVASEVPGVRYVREPRPGLSWARNRAVVECVGDVIAFVDDDVTVDKQWAGRLQWAVAQNPAAGVVTGLVCPGELETEAQGQFEGHGGFGRGCDPKWFHPPVGPGGLHWKCAATGSLGTGANMAFRRTVFEQVGLFAPELGAGTRTEGGEDLEMLYRVIKHSIPIVYEPRAFAWHRHRREVEALVKQMHSWGTGCHAFVHHAKRLFPEEASGLRRFELFRMSVLLKRIVGEYVRPGRMPAELPSSEFVGAVVARRRYREARESVREIEAKYGALNDARFPEAPGLLSRVNDVFPNDVAVRKVDLARGIEALHGLVAHGKTRVSISANGRPLAHLEIENRGLDISRDQLINGLVEIRPVAEWLALVEEVPIAEAEAALRKNVLQVVFPGLDRGARASESLPPAVPVSIVLVARRTTLEFRRQLAALTTFAKQRPCDLIVVSGDPRRSLPSVRADFPAVRCARATEPGLSSALNAGFRMARHDIIVCTSDEVVPADDWLERLLAPFARNDIDVVCGRVSPAEGRAQVPSSNEAAASPEETSADLGADWFFSRWFRALPTQRWGTTANMAFRRQLLTDTQVGGFDRALGPGVPSGGGEAAYFFYKALRHGYKLRYQPDAVTWHQCDDRKTELARQHFEDGKGHVAGQLHLFLKDRDFRALGMIVDLPRLHFTRLVSAIRLAADALPPSVILAELAGNIVGPYSLWKSYRQWKAIDAAADPQPPRSETDAQEKDEEPT